MVFKSLRVVDLPGQPTFGECSEQWVFDFVAAIFGAYDGASGQRLITEFFLLISKKNGKSTISAGIMLTALIRNWRYSAELLLLAPTLEVAKNAWKPLVDMVRADPALEDLLHIQENFRQVTHRTRGAVLKVVSADTKVVGGKKAAFVLVDELWEFGKNEKAGPMLMEATGGLVSRAEGFVIYLSTQSDAPPAGVFAEKLSLYRDIRDGRIVDPKKLGVLFEFPEKLIDAEAYLDPAKFYVTNPNIGRSVSHEWLVEKLIENQRKDRGNLNIFLAKHLNVEIGSRLRANRWPGAEYWDKREDASVTLATILDLCEAVVVGIDGGGLDDLFGLCVLGRERVATDFLVRGPDGEVRHQPIKRWMAWHHAWCHEGVLERRKAIASVLRGFERDGDLTIVGDELADTSAIIEVVEQIKDRGILAHVAVDPAGLGELGVSLSEIGVTLESELLKGAPQGYAMMNAIKTAERNLAKKMLRVAPSALMRWCVGNLKIEPTATAIRATKQNAGDAKIDPVMALFDAVTFMSLNPQPNVVADVGAMIA